ncbi:MAG: hypothetical protein QF464_10715, partial [Myxococcota bacterium]|nr:hypothetical protein [Myxococcota bacterium]
MNGHGRLLRCDGAGFGVTTGRRGAHIFFWKALAVKAVAVAAAACLWLPCIHLFFAVDTADYRRDDGIAPKARMLAERHLAIWRDPALRARELDALQRLNPEWDLMSRTFFALALANMALRDPAYEDVACDIIDAILENTLRLETDKGHTHYLLGYA